MVLSSKIMHMVYVVCIPPISYELLETVAACCKQCGMETSSTKVCVPMNGNGALNYPG